MKLRIPLGLLVALAVAGVLAGCGGASAHRTASNGVTVVPTTAAASPSATPTAPATSPTSSPTVPTPNYTQTQVAGEVSGSGSPDNAGIPMPFNSPVMASGWGMHYDYTCPVYAAQVDDNGSIMTVSIQLGNSAMQLAGFKSQHGTGFVYAPPGLLAGSYRMGVAGSCQWKLTFVDLKGHAKTQSLAGGKLQSTKLSLLVNPPWTLYWSFYCPSWQHFTVTDTTTNTVLVGQTGTFGADTYGSATALNGDTLHIAADPGCTWSTAIRSAG